MPSSPTVLDLRSLGLFETKNLSRSSRQVSATTGREFVLIDLDTQFEAVKIIGKESGLQDMTHLIVIAGDFQLLDRSSNRKIVDKYASLFEGALCNTMNFPKFQIP